MGASATLSGYSRLRTGPVEAFLLGGCQSLWLAEDHLLVVDDTWLVRTVRRVDLRDIEAIALRRTAGFAWVNALAGLLGGLGLVLLATGSFGWAVLGALIAGACLPVLAVNLFRGPTCACRLQTRVGTWPLTALRRYRAARRVLADLEPRIRAAQADLPPVAERLAVLGAAGVAAPEAVVEPQPARPARHVLHAVFFAGLAVQAALLALAAGMPSLPTVAGAAGCGLALVVAAVAALACQHRVAVARRLRLVTWVAGAGTLIGAMTAYLGFLVAVVVTGVMDDPSMVGSQLDKGLIRLARYAAEEGLPVWLQAVLSAAALAAALAAWAGFAAYLSAGRASSRPGAPQGGPTWGR